MRRWIGWAALTLTLAACGSQRPKDDRVGAAPVERMELSDDGLRMEFAPRVEREDAVEHVLRCRLEEDPDNPRLSRVACPVVPPVPYGAAQMRFHMAALRRGFQRIVD